MALPHWDDPDSFAWDIAVIAGRAFPAIVTITGAVERKVDVQKSRGSDGARLKDEGYDPATLTITMRIATEASWNELQILIDEVHPRRKGGTRVPVTLEHPAPNLLGIDRIYVKRINFPTIGSSGDGRGIMTITFDCIEWFPAPKKVKTAAGSGAKPKSTTITNPQNPANTFVQPLASTVDDDALVDDDFADFLNNSF